MNGSNNDLMDHASESTPNVGMSRPTAGFHSETPSQLSRQLRTTQMDSQSAGSDILHRTTSGTPSAASSDGDSSFSETADKLLSPQSKNIEDARFEYYHVKNDCDKGIGEVLSYLPSTMDDGQRTTLQQYILLLELRLAKAKLRVDLAVSHRADQYDQQNAIGLPKLAITKGWLDEGLRRIETPTTKLDYEPGYLFWELSHFFLATIITQHHDFMFEGRMLPSVYEIVDIFQQTEPRSYTPGIGPFLELATGMNTSDPLLMPEILRQLESRMATDTSVNDRRNFDTNISPREIQAQLGHHPMKARAYRPPAYITTADGTQHEIDPYLDSSPVGNSPAAYQRHHEDSIEDSAEPLQDQNSAESEHDPQGDLALTADETLLEIDPHLDDSSGGNSPAERQSYQCDDNFEEDVAPMQDGTSVRSEHGLEGNMASTLQVKFEYDQETVRPHVVDTRRVELVTDQEMLVAELDGVSARQMDLDVDMDHHDEVIYQTADPLPFHAIRDGSTGLDAIQINNQSLGLNSDVFDEVMRDIENDSGAPYITSITPAVAQIARRAISDRYSIPDNFVMSDDGPKPDSNPFLAAHRAKVAASGTGAAAPAAVSTSSTPAVISKSDTPASSTPVVPLSESTCLAKPLQSEPIVLMSSPTRSLTEQLFTGRSTSQRQSSRVDDSIFISDDDSDDDSDDELPPSSNPHLATLIQARATVPASTPASGSNTPTSIASSNRAAKVKLPPHLARVRRAAHRTSLDPSSQLATPEEMRLLDQEEYPLIDIIDEKIVDGEKKYLIKWKPIHGRRFLDTWEPAENANAASVEDWETEKARREKEKAPTKSKKARAKEKERGQRPVEKIAAEPASQNSLEEDTRMSFANTASDESLISRGARSVSASLTSSSSDQVSSRTRSRLNIGDESFITSSESTTRLTPESASDPPPRYAAQPFSINAVSPEPMANTALEPLPNTAAEAAPASSTRVDKSNKYKTQKQQKARMREKREIRRAEKAERLANMTEEKRAELEHSKKMQKMSKRKRKETKAERLAAMSEEERKELEDWLQWKKGVRARTKQDKKNRQANKAKKREEEAQKQAQKAAKSS
jgi:hypothetical protein